ncbi:hypothetical protein ABMY26_33845 [Azospirillum sp. HJ39]|uniref:hypothetical protein n=1 Tax=Azospirillum sp. HJ39 TaxID=3159496 RepID=UPI0035572AA3
MSIATVLDPKQAIATDALTTRVIANIRGLIDGNGAEARDLEVVSATRVDRVIGLRLEVGIRWTSERQDSTGARNPEGSNHCRDHAAMVARMEKECGARAVSPDASGALAEVIRKDPIGKLRTLADGFNVQALPLRYHYHDRCGKCGGDGQTKCGSCYGGEVPCSCGDGRSRCFRCFGSGQVQEPYTWWNGHQHVRDSRMVTCGTCAGSGRWGVCTLGCGGSRQVTCMRCGGTDRLPCSPCGATGWFTRLFSTSLIGKPVRRCLLPQDAPQEFRSAVEKIAITELPGLHADTGLVKIEPGLGTVVAEYDSTIPHVRAEMRAGHVDIEVDAVGKTGRVVEMPTFLDDLLSEVLLNVGRADQAPARAIAAAKMARLTRSLLEAVSTSGRPVDVGGVVRIHQGAVSDWAVAGAYDGLRAAYDLIGRSPVRRVWIVGGPLAAAWAAAVPHFGIGDAAVREATALLEIGVLPPEAGPAAGALIAALPLIAAWRLAATTGRRAVRGVVGADARRAPSQGRLPWIVTLAAVGLHLAVANLPAITRAAEDLARAARGTSLPTLTEIPIVGELIRIAPEALFGLSGSGLPPSDKPRLEPRLPGPADLPANTAEADAYRARSALAQLGFFKGRIDGRRWAAADRAALDAMLRTAPPASSSAMARYKEASAATIIEGALNGEYRLKLPADSTLAGPLSNLARGNLTADDLQRLQTAADRAATEAGREQAWRSADGKRGGRVLAHAEGGQGCSRVHLEVEVGGAVEQAAVQLACVEGGRLLPR